MRKIIKFICGIFDKNYGLCTNYIADNINNVLPILNNYSNIIFVGDGFNIHKNILTGHYHESSIYAKNIGIAAYNKHIQGIKYESDLVHPEYLKPSQAERLKQ